MLLLKLHLGSTAGWRQHFGGGGSRRIVAGRFPSNENACWKYAWTQTQKIGVCASSYLPPAPMELEWCRFFAFLPSPICADSVSSRSSGTMDLRTQHVKVFANEKLLWEREARSEIFREFLVWKQNLAASAKTAVTSEALSWQNAGARLEQRRQVLCCVSNKNRASLHICSESCDVNAIAVPQRKPHVVWKNVQD